jgi:hypothetical protein
MEETYRLEQRNELCSQQSAYQFPSNPRIKASLIKTLQNDCSSGMNQMIGPYCLRSKQQTRSPLIYTTYNNGSTDAMNNPNSYAQSFYLNKQINANGESENIIGKKIAVYRNTSQRYPDDSKPKVKSGILRRTSFADQHQLLQEHSRQQINQNPIKHLNDIQQANGMMCLSKNYGEIRNGLQESPRNSINYPTKARLQPKNQSQLQASNQYYAQYIEKIKNNSSSLISINDKQEQGSFLKPNEMHANEKKIIMSSTSALSQLDLNNESQKSLDNNLCESIEIIKKLADSTQSVDELCENKQLIRHFEDNSVESNSSLSCSGCLNEMKTASNSDVNIGGITYINIENSIACEKSSKHERDAMTNKYEVSNVMSCKNFEEIANEIGKFHPDQIRQTECGNVILINKIDYPQFENEKDEMNDAKSIQTTSPDFVSIDSSKKDFEQEKANNKMTQSSGTSIIMIGSDFDSKGQVKSQQVKENQLSMSYNVDANQAKCANEILRSNSQSHHLHRQPSMNRFKNPFIINAQSINKNENASAASGATCTLKRNASMPSKTLIRKNISQFYDIKSRIMQFENIQVEQPALNQKNCMSVSNTQGAKKSNYPGKIQLNDQVQVQNQAESASCSSSSKIPQDFHSSVKVKELKNIFEASLKDF